MRPSMEKVTTCQGMNLPLFFRAVTAACSRPPQQGTSMRSTVTLRMSFWERMAAVSYTHLRAHETDSYLVCRLLLEKKKNQT